MSTLHVKSEQNYRLEFQCRLHELEEENSFLRESVRQLNNILTNDNIAPLSWKLTMKERLILGLLVSRPMVSTDSIMTVLCFNIEKDCLDLGTIHSHICHLRRKLSGHGIVIENARGVGYAISNAARLRLAAQRSGKTEGGE